MAEKLTAEQVLQAIQQMGIDPASAFKLIEIVYMTPQEEMAKVKQALQSGGQQGQPQEGGGGEGGGQPSEDQIIQAVAEMLQQGAAPEQVVAELQKQGATPEQAKQIVKMVMDKMGAGQGQAPEQEGQPRV